MSPRPLRIFISYSHADEADKNRLRISLSPLVQTGLAELWHDREILAGADWLAEIEGALAGADAALFLVSPDFLASRFCIEKEVPALLERHYASGVLILFYSQGSRHQATSASTFLVGALKELGIGFAPDAPDEELGRLLAEEAARAPSVPVLDGLEPLQQAAPADPQGHGSLKDRALAAFERAEAVQAENDPESPKRTASPASLTPSSCWSGRPRPGSGGRCWSGGAMPWRSCKGSSTSCPRPWTTAPSARPCPPSASPARGPPWTGPWPPCSWRAESIFKR
jgi:hypothetical protein